MTSQVQDRTFPPLAHRVASDIGTRAVDKAWKSPTRQAWAPHTKPRRTCPLDFGAKTDELSPALPSNTIKLTRHAMKAGTDAALLLPPFYYKTVSDEGLYQSYARVIYGVADPALRTILYHFPNMASVCISNELISRLIKDFPETIVGIKNSTGDQSHTTARNECLPGLDSYATRRCIRPRKATSVTSA